MLVIQKVSLLVTFTRKKVSFSGQKYKKNVIVTKKEKNIFELFFHYFLSDRCMVIQSP